MTNEQSVITACRSLLVGEMNKKSNGNAVAKINEVQ